MIVTGQHEHGVDYYDSVYSESKEYRKPYHDNVYTRLNKTIANFCKAPVLDIGCGAGHLVAMLNDKGIIATGIDYSEVGINLAKANYPKWADRFSVGNAFDVKDAQECVVLSEILEHIKEDRKLVREIDAKKVILSVPNFDAKSHVRYFESANDVRDRYGRYFKTHTVLTEDRWFILIGTK